MHNVTPIKFSATEININEEMMKGVALSTDMHSHQFLELRKATGNVYNNPMAPFQAFC